MNHFENRAYILYIVCVVLHYIIPCLLPYKLIQVNKSTHLLWSTKLFVFRVSWFGTCERITHSVLPLVGKLPLLRPVRFDVLCRHPCLTVHVPWDSWFAYKYAGRTVVRSSLALEQEWDPTGVFRGSAVLEQMYKLFTYLLSVGSLFEMVLLEKYSFSALSRRGCLLTILHFRESAFCTLYRQASCKPAGPLLRWLNGAFPCTSENICSFINAPFDS